jgi:murein DD-endopeptidase MepM/ murein hydrolase activator NlpD/muramidase (phage lysozyme)
MLGEQERASSCSISIYDHKLKLLNLLLTEFQRVGGIFVSKELFEDKKVDLSESSSGTPIINNDPNGYLKQLEQKYGASDLSGLTPVGRKAYSALSNPNVRAFLDAVAIAELGDNAAAKGGYGYLFGDVNGVETFDPKTLMTHPLRRRSASGYTSSATGRYQTMDFVWNDDTAYGSRGLGLKDFKPISQEILAVGRMMYRGILEEVEKGDIEAALNGDGRKGNGASWEWASLEPKRYGQGTPGGRKVNFIANYNRFKAASKTIQSPTTPINNLPSAVPSLTELKTSRQTGENKLDVTQGIRIYIELGFNDIAPTIYEFILTEVQGSDRIPHTTTIQGRQVRAIAAKSSKSFGVKRNTTIRQFAGEITSKIGADLEISDNADTDKILTIVQKNETDYQALVRAAATVGLFIRGDANKLKLEPLKVTDKIRVVLPEAIAPGSTWGDSASSERSAPTITSTVSPKSGGTTEQSGTDLPSVSKELEKLATPVNLNKVGILLPNSAADEKKGIGKGFEGQLQILSVLQPDVLNWQPGEIVLPQTGYGLAIDREYRISQIRHNWSNGAMTEGRSSTIASSASIYLPVAIVIKQDTATQGGAVSGAGVVSSSGNQLYEKWDPRWKKAAARGDVIEGTGRRVTSPYGMRIHPVTKVRKMHNGTDVDCNMRTKLYAVCKPGESVNVEYIPRWGGAGNTVKYEYGEFTFYYFHLDSGGSGKYNHGQIIAYSGNTGIGTAPHLHVEIYKTKEGASKRFAIPLGYLYWILTGNFPP